VSDLHEDGNLRLPWASPTSFTPEEASCRMFRCARCPPGFLSVGGAIEARSTGAGACAQEGRRDRQKEARRRYQATAHGRAMHAERNRRYRARRRRVTDHGLAKVDDGGPSPAMGSTKRRRPANGHERTCSAIIAGSRLPHFCACQPFIPDAVECRLAVPAATADSLADHPDRLPPEKCGFAQPLTCVMLIEAKNTPKARGPYKKRLAA
jgi:hypothetical protein